MTDISRLDTDDLLLLISTEKGIEIVDNHASLEQMIDLESALIDLFATMHCGHEDLVHWEASEYVH